MLINNVIDVRNVLIRKEVVDTHFACDLEKCKGACCTIESPFGAPLKAEEIDKISKVLPEVLKYLPEEHQEIIRKDGFFDEKYNELMTKSVNGKACVFVYFERGIAKCGIEKAFYDGKSDFQKPISCHLFPIRIAEFGGEVLRYEKFSECEPALANGEKENITVVEFCKDSLVRKYGEQWYSELKEESAK
jgi:hypothetical protein